MEVFDGSRPAGSIPRAVGEAAKLDEIAYDELLEMAGAGSKRSKVTVVIAEKDADRAAQLTHKAFGLATFGPAAD